MKETDTALWAECDRVCDGLVRMHTHTLTDGEKEGKRESERAT